LTQLSLFPHDAPAASFDERVNYFAEIPYRNGAFARRNWGHPFHSLCSYPSKLKPAIAHTLISIFTRPGDRVLDVFSGCGTIPFEACLLGRVGIGADLSPLAYRLTRAKIAMPSKHEVFAELENLYDLFRSGITADDSQVPEKVRSFYHANTLNEILIAKNILEQRLKSGSTAAGVVWSVIAHILHGNRPYALSRRSHNIIPIPPKGDIVYKSLVGSAKSKMARLYAKPFPLTCIPGEAYESDALDLELSEPVDALITSPPFLGTTEFLKQNWLRMWFAGWGASAIAAKIPEFLEYQRDLSQYAPFFKRFRTLLRANGLLILHLGVVKKIDMALELMPFAEAAGFRTIGLVYEDTRDLESHGRTDRGGTHTHQFLFMSAS
jgi:hypothetical protein